MFSLAMTIHYEGYLTLLVTLLVLSTTHYLICRYSSFRQSIGYKVFKILSVVLYVWLLSFFRNPHREIVLRDSCILSPADGKVISIQKRMEGEYFKDNRTQISIFMSPFNVHVNRSPLTGVVKFFRYHQGEYLVAWHPKSSTKNERTTIVVQNDDGVEVLFRQIAGFLARRIRYYIQEGDHLQQGEEFGFIKFGSRMDVFLPTGATVKAKVGDQVQGGLSVLAEMHRER